MIDELIDAIKRAGAVAHEEQKKSQNTFVAPTDGGPVTLVQQPVSRGKIVAVYSPKGGAGRTTIATNLAIALKEENRVALIDASLQFGDVAVFLNEQGKNTILDLAPRASELDPDIVQEVMLTHKASGIDVLAAPPTPDLSVFNKVTGEQFGLLLDYLRRMYSYLIVDTTTALDLIWGATMDAANVIVLVVTQDIPSIKNTSSFLKMAEVEGIKRDKFLVVMNKYDRRINIAPERVGEILRQPISLTVPFDDKIVNSAIIRGTPFMVDNKVQPIAKAVQSLADMVRDKITKLEAVEVPPPAKK